MRGADLVADLPLARSMNALAFDATCLHVVAVSHEVTVKGNVRLLPPEFWREKLNHFQHLYNLVMA